MEPSETPRAHPNICISGTPGTGKTTLAKALAAASTDLKHIDVNAEARTHDCIVGYDKKLKCDEVDEDKLADILEPLYLTKGGCVIDWMHANFWAPKYIDLCITLRAATETLYDRYKTRGYDDDKVQENLNCEIFGDIALENEEFFEGKDTSLLELSSDEGEGKGVEESVKRVEDWIKSWYTESGNH